MMPRKFRSIVVAVLATSANAYSVVPPRKTKTSTSAIGYTMEMPDFTTSLPKSTWYDVANPTARRIVYDDGPSEVMYPSIGNNWDAFEEDEPMAEPPRNIARQTLSLINPVRHARSLIRWVF
mmetsp:Transcript_17183/g.35447  ORF Transcript_17183/g.35447 Transcript_17183/m.35447 type:complete len:122 (-) Transcript_17183:200-565(-)